MCLLLITCLISLQSMRFVTFSIGTTFLLPLVLFFFFFFVALLNVSRPGIHTLQWVQYSTTGLWMKTYLKTPLFLRYPLYISVLLCPSFDIKVPKYLNLFPLIEKDFDLWTLILSTDNDCFCLFAVQFQSFQLSSSTMSNNRCKPFVFSAMSSSCLCCALLF